MATVWAPRGGPWWGPWGWEAWGPAGPWLEWLPTGEELMPCGDTLGWKLPLAGLCLQGAKLIIKVKIYFSA